MSKNSSSLIDVLSGVEPTGVYTYRNALTNKNHHTRHKILGDLGGFVGGAVLSTGITGAGAIASGKILSKFEKTKGLGRILTTSGYSALSLLNPKKAYKAIKQIPEASKLTKKIQQVPDEISNVVKNIDKFNPGKKVDIKNLTGKAKQYKTILEDYKNYKDKYNESPINNVAHGVTVVGAGITATLSGALNATSAHVQYNSGLKMNRTNTIEKLAKLWFPTVEPFGHPKDLDEYKSLKGYAREVGNRAVSELAGAGAYGSAAAGVAAALAAAITRKAEIAAAAAATAGIAGAIAGGVGSYKRSINRTEEEAGIQKKYQTTVPQLIGRNVASVLGNAVLPIIGGLGMDYYISRHAQDKN